MRRTLTYTGFLLIFLSLWFISAAYQASAAKLSAQAAIEKSEVYLGESFIFQVQVEGDDSPDQPDLSGIANFIAQSLGGRQNSSSSVTIINGKVTKNLRRGYIFSYRLTPKKAGTLTIPAIEVSAGSQKVRTLALRIRVAVPVETENFKLRMELSSDKCYVGQPITLTVIWYVGKDVEEFQFNLPVLMDERFALADLDTPIDPKKKDRYLRIPLGDGEANGEKGRGRLNGTDYLTVRFQKILIPQRSGDITIPRGTIACNAVVGHQQQRRSRDPFFDDFFGSRRQAIVKKFVVPSNEPILTVLDLPEEGRPDNFTGLVGKYNVVADAVPTEVRVGDPITFTIRVSGQDYLEDVKLPPLHRQPVLDRDFKIPAEMASGKMEGSAKTFTQTLRVKHEDVKTIPSIALPYFDTGTGRYAVAYTKPISLSVKPTRIITVLDAEGRALPKVNQSELESWAAGIAHNYEDLSVLRDQVYGPAMWIRSSLWMGLIGLPPVTYFILLLSVTIIRRQKADPAAQQARQAYGILVKTLKNGKTSASVDSAKIYALVLEAFQQYLGSKLFLPPRAITFNDVKDRLLKQGVNDDVIVGLKELFEKCEASRYAGSTTGNDTSLGVIDSAIALVKDLEYNL